MFRVKRKETKWKRLDTIAELLQNEDTKRAAQEYIIDYIYDFYDGLERSNFPNDRKDLGFSYSYFQPILVYYSDDSNSPKSVSSILVRLIARSSRKQFHIEIFWDYSFLTELECDRWHESPGLDDV